MQPRILVADDQADILSALKLLLKREGFDVATASSPAGVLDITARGTTIAEAQARAYRAVDLIDWPEGFCRREIGWRAIAREKDPHSVRRR